MSLAKKSQSGQKKNPAWKERAGAGMLFRAYFFWFHKPTLDCSWIRYAILSFLLSLLSTPLLFSFPISKFSRRLCPFHSALAGNGQAHHSTEDYFHYSDIAIREIEVRPKTTRRIGIGEKHAKTTEQFRGG